MIMKEIMKDSKRYNDTLLLPKTNFEMRANLPEKELDTLQFWKDIGLWRELRKASKGRKKFIKRDWSKKNKNAGGGTSCLLTDGNIFEKVGVNKSTVSGTFSKEYRSKILGANKDGKYWASGISVVAHMKNPKIPAIHFNTRFIVTNKEWFGGGMDVTPSYKDTKEKNLKLTSRTIGTIGLVILINQ